MQPLSTLALLLVASAVLVSGCAPLAITAAGVGGGAGVTHAMGGYTYKTFTAPVGKVRSASLSALKKMGISVASSEKTGEGELIKAKAGDRDIEITLDVISPNTTRMRTVARKGLFYDSATSTEIILQTEKILG